MQEERQEQLQEHEGSGRKGGATAAAIGVASEATHPLVIQDRVRWSPVWAGFLVTVAVQIVLGALILAITLGKYDVYSAEFARNAGNLMGIWSAIVLVLSLFAGALVAGRLAAAAGVHDGLLHGTVVWALALLACTVLGALRISGTVPSLSGALPALQVLSSDLGKDVITSATRTAAWWFVLGSVVAWLGAVWGGAIGAGRRGEES